MTLQTGSLPVGFCSHISPKWCSWDKEILEGRSEPEAKAADWGSLPGTIVGTDAQDGPFRLRPPPCLSLFHASRWKGKGT